MRFALFVSVVPDEHDSPVKVRPEKVFAITQDPERVDVCELHVPGGVFVVRGTVDEVSAVLEAAGAPPVAAAVASSDEAESAAMVLDLLADAAAQRDLGFVDGGAVDDVIGASGADWDSTEATLRALAAKLRGGG